MYEIFAGDFYATKEQGVVLTTLLGSCISVCMKDRVTGIVGINHFMLPGTVRLEEIIFNEDARYGINAMEKMINSMMKLGAKRASLQAKVFGGGRVLDTKLNNVAQSNMEFAMAYLEMETIPVLKSDVGGNFGRKLYFFPENYAVYLKKVHYQKTLSSAVERDRQFYQWMQKQRKTESDLTLFNG